MNKKFTFISPVIFTITLLYTNSYSQNRTEYDLFSQSDNSSVMDNPELKKL
ncbi:MAG: hypothetical protein M3R36_11490 [Bacteroidota bacterium]|nr:hypothetical protein [Bacteroidota bacterium]